MHPVFFSVASHDLGVAKAVWSSFTANDIYLYSESGEEGAWFWEEIEAELKQTRGIVIFWSANFVKNEGTTREIRFAAERFGANLLLREAIIVRLDDTPLTCPEGASPVIGLVYQDLKVFLNHVRAMDPNTEPTVIVSRVDQLIAKVRPESLPPFFPRPTLVSEFHVRSRATNRQTFPVVWVEGLNGNGRRTMIREAYRSFSQTAIPVEISVNELQLQKQLALRIASEALGASIAELDAINKDPRFDTPEGIVELVERAWKNNNRYLIILQDWLDRRPTAVPQWLIEVFTLLNQENRPKIFFATPIRCPETLLTGDGKHVCRVRIPWLTELEAEEFCDSLVAHYDPSRENRWSNQTRQAVVKASGGNPKLLIDIVRVGSQLDSLHTLQRWATEKSERFSAAMSQYLAWVVDNIPRGGIDRQLLQLLLEVNPMSLEMLQEFLDRHPVADALGRMQSIGLVEQWGDGLYRIAPLLQRRLKRQLATTQEDLAAVHEALLRFARKPRLVEASGHVYVRIEAAIRAGLRTSGTVPEAVSQYVSAAHMFEMGIRLYDARNTASAFPLLYEAFKQRARFEQSVAAEVCRFYGLAAVRMHKDEHVEGALNALKTSNAPDLSDYLIGYRYELDGRFASAISSYKSALDAAVYRKNVRRSELIRPRLIASILRSPQPKWTWAIELARTAVERSDSVFALRSLAQACLESVYFDESMPDPERNAVWAEYSRTLDKLKKNPTGGSIYAEIEARKAELDDDYPKALEWAQTAAALGERIEQRFQVWHVKLLMKEADELSKLVEEIKVELGKPTSRARHELLAPTLSFAVRAYVLLEQQQQARQLIQRYSSELSSAQLDRLRNLTSNGEDAHDHGLEFIVP
jgi:hypothetical protein